MHCLRFQFVQSVITETALFVTVRLKGAKRNSPTVKLNRSKNIINHTGVSTLYVNERARLLWSILPVGEVTNIGLVFVGKKDRNEF